MSNLTETKNQSGMSISDLKPGMRRVDITGQIADIETPRDVQTKFGPGQVASATLQDSSGATIKLTLWNENIEKVSVGDTVHIENAYVDSFRGELQLQVGRYGKISNQ
jgi:replication factor A1